MSTQRNQYVMSKRRLSRRKNPALKVHKVFYLYDVEELMPVDAAIAVHIIEFEIPAQLVLHLSPHHQTESGHVLHEVYVAVLQKQAAT